MFENVELQLNYRCAEPEGQHMAKLTSEATFNTGEQHEVFDGVLLGQSLLVEMPNFARRSGGGSVTARVRVGAGGAAASVPASGGNETLREEVERSLKSSTSYLESCEGHEVEIVFNFLLKGKATDDWPVRGVFHIPTAPAAVLSLPHCSFRFATLSEVGQIKWPRVGQSGWPNAISIGTGYFRQGY